MDFYITLCPTLSFDFPPHLRYILLNQQQAKVKDLEQELEIEFKNMLTLEEYKGLLQNKFLKHMKCTTKLILGLVNIQIILICKSILTSYLWREILSIK